MSEPTKQDRPVAEELKELGRQIASAVRSVASSGDVRQLGSEVRDGLNAMVAEVDAMLAKLREREEMQQVRAKAERVADSFRTGEAQREVRSELAAALRTLNEQLSKLSERLEPKEGVAQTADATEQAAGAPTDTASTHTAIVDVGTAPDAPVDPYTGDTKRLDDEDTR
jgi:chromosome segregation ATPase